jgi:hypothetical protein
MVNINYINIEKTETKKNNIFTKSKYNTLSKRFSTLEQKVESDNEVDETTEDSNNEKNNEKKVVDDTPEYTKSSSYLEKIKSMSEGLVKRIQTGIKSSCSRIDQKIDMFKGDKLISKNDFDDNYPQIFYSIRKFSNIPEKEYLDSICSGEMKIIITPGKSGALLFFTKDGAFIIKTVTKSEYSFLQKNITEYSKFLLNNPHTLLVKFTGKFKLLNKAYFLVNLIKKLYNLL